MKSNNLLKAVFIILLALVMAGGGFFGGYVAGQKKETSFDAYDVLYKQLDSMTSEEKIEYYTQIQRVETSPTQMKYVLNKIIEDPRITDEAKNNAFAYYLNHIQYYMTTYSNFVTLYSHIIMNDRQTIDYESPESANQVNDGLLKALLTEIYAGDMKIKMPSLLSTDGRPYVIIDYDKLDSEFGSIYNGATRSYIKFKQIVQNGELANSDGSYNKEKLADYMMFASEFIQKYPQYPLIEDFVYSYILASKMYIDTYNVSEEFYISDTDAERYKKFVEEHYNEPLSQILELLIEKYENGEPVTTEEADIYNRQLDSLLSSSSQ